MANFPVARSTIKKAVHLNRMSETRTIYVIGRLSSENKWIDETTCRIDHKN